jgi:peptide/nickel transport system substrate-binding protein
MIARAADSAASSGGPHAGHAVQPSPPPRGTTHARAPHLRGGGHPSGGRHQVATGPYLIQNDAQGNTVGYRPGRGLLLVRNPNWDRATDFRPALLDRIDVRMGNEDTAAASRRILTGRRLASGDFGVESSVLRREARSRRVQFAFVAAGGVAFVSLNTKLAPFDDADVRRAVVAGWDRRAEQRLAGGSLAGPIATHFIPPGVPGFEEAGGLRGPGLALYASPNGSVRRAASYLRRAGFPSGRFTGRRPIVVVTLTDPSARPFDRLTRRLLTRLGFQVRFRRLDSDEAFEVCGTARARVHICSGGFVSDFRDAETVLSPVFNGASIRARSNSNASQLDDPGVNRAMRAAQALTDPEARARAWAAIDRRITALAPAIAIGWPRSVSIRSTDVAGVPSRIFPGTWDLSFTGLR